MTGEPAVFVSHASADDRLAAAVVRLIEIGTKIPSRSIRCSSVNGFRFGAGTDVDAALQREIVGALAFVALLTPRSLVSTYVLFELGARWGARKHFFPLLARGATDALTQGPLNGINALDLTDRGQVAAFIEELADALGREPERPSSKTFEEAILAVVAEAGTTDLIPALNAPGQTTTDPDKMALRKMRVALKSEPKKWLYLFELATLAGIPEADATRLLKNEADVGFKKPGGSLLAAYFIDPD